MMRRLLAAGAVAVGLVGTPASAQRATPVHEHDTGHVHTHRGPGPHFIDAFFTENAYVERKIRPDLGFVAGPEGDRYFGTLEVEWAVAPAISLIVHAPFQHLRPDQGDAQTGFGDASIGAKYAVVNDRTRFIFALGADLALPTGDETRGLGTGHAAAAPFALAWLPFGPERRWLLQGGAHVEIPLAGDESEHLEIGGALSWTSSLGITPLLEGIVEIPLDREAASWFVAPEARWEFLPAWEAGAAIRIPLAGPEADEEDWRLLVGLIRHFRLPGETASADHD